MFPLSYPGHSVHELLVRAVQGKYDALPLSTPGSPEDQLREIVNMLLVTNPENRAAAQDLVQIPIVAKAVHSRVTQTSVFQRPAARQLSAVMARDSRRAALAVSSRVGAVMHGPCPRGWGRVLEGGRQRELCMLEETTALPLRVDPRSKFEYTCHL